MNTPIGIDFYYELDSRYSYLASTQLDRYESDLGCTFIYKPVKRGSLSRLRGASPFRGQPVSGQYESSWRLKDAILWAEYYGVPYHDIGAHRPELISLPAVAAGAALRLGLGRGFTRQLFRSFFVDRIHVTRDTCMDDAQRVGIDVDSFAITLDDPETERLVDFYAAEAHESGVFGVPSFVVDGQMIFGNDRLVLVKHLIRRLKN